MYTESKKELTELCKGKSLFIKCGNTNFRTTRGEITKKSKGVNIYASYELSSDQKKLLITHFQTMERKNNG